jgi:hypothetical protein
MRSLRRYPLLTVVEQPGVVIPVYRIPFELRQQTP